MSKNQKKSIRKTPSYRQRTGYDQALVTLTDSATGRRSPRSSRSSEGERRRAKPNPSARRRRTLSMLPARS